MAVNHVILKEFHVDRQVPYFIDYLKRYTDAPFLVKLERRGEGFRPGRYLRARRLAALPRSGERRLEARWSGTAASRACPKAPSASAGETRRASGTSKWRTGWTTARSNPCLTLPRVAGRCAARRLSRLRREAAPRARTCRCSYVETARRAGAVTTVFDLLMAQFGVGRGLPGEYPSSYDDAALTRPPGRKRLQRDRPRDASSALPGSSPPTPRPPRAGRMIIIGAGVNHWYHNNLAYRAPVTALDALRLLRDETAAGSTTTWARKSWRLRSLGEHGLCPRLAEAPAAASRRPSGTTCNSDQWRYEGDFTDYCGRARRMPAGQRAMPSTRSPGRCGWAGCPSIPSSTAIRSSWCAQAEEAGAQDRRGDRRVDGGAAEARKLRFAVNDPDAPENWPRVWLIWRGNALLASGKGHEYILRHYLGTHDNAWPRRRAEGSVKTVAFREPAPRGKMDLVVDLNFRMDTSALYSDIVLPAAMWYEKNDLNTTDMHSFVHHSGRGGAAGLGGEERLGDLQGARREGERAGPAAFPGPVARPGGLAASCTTRRTRSPSRRCATGPRASAQPVPGKTHAAPARGRARLRESLPTASSPSGRWRARTGIMGNGVTIPCETLYDELLQSPVGGTPDPWHRRCVRWGGQKLPEPGRRAGCGERRAATWPRRPTAKPPTPAFSHEEEKTGVPLADLAQRGQGVRLHSGTSCGSRGAS